MVTVNNPLTKILQLNCRYWINKSLELLRWARSATKAFLNTNPSIDNVIAFANVDDMLIPLEINQTQINMSKPPNVPHDKFAALFLPQEYFEERKRKIIVSVKNHVLQKFEASLDILVT